MHDHKWTDEEALHAVRALWNGECDAATQRVAIKYVLEVLGGINSIPLVPGSPDVTAFNCGRAWVARQIQLAITLPLKELREQADEPRDTRTIPTATERSASSRNRRIT